MAEGGRIVLTDRPLDGLRCSAVTTDDVQVGMLATEHLIRLGHREIGHLGGTGVSTSTGRFHGYHQALTKHGLPLHDVLVRECGFTEDPGYEAMKAWVQE